MPEAADLRRVAADAGDGWDLRVVGVVPSTHTLMRQAALAGAAEGTAVVADEQTAGRGRLQRSWAAPPGTAVLISWVWRPARVPAPAWGWLPLLAGVAVSEALRRSAGVPIALKWPNDVLAEAVGPGDRSGKVAGILAERVETRAGPAAVVGVGVNVDQRAEQLPVDTATSLRLAGAGEVSRADLLSDVLTALAVRYRAWVAAAGDGDVCGLAPEYLRACSTVGRSVSVSLPGERSLTGRAEGIAPDGQLIVVNDQGRHVVGAGDVVHVR
jgi:BirA family transcriptional regulator, biotin operon repressor / biotin---[acetyl-CoA-carboxylase] ligase